MKNKIVELITYIDEKIFEIRDIEVDEDWSVTDGPYCDKVHITVGSNQTIREKE